jgi:hypothetical protein
MDECKVCANADNEYCFACDNGNKFKPMTNADRINVMTNEEKARFLAANQLDLLNLVLKPLEIKLDIDKEAVISEWVDWLKQEVNYE